MDSCVIDLSNTKVEEGDRVEVFGPNNNIMDICKKINSTPYEFLSSINRRIKRIYI
jgi:alanine racemase